MPRIRTIKPELFMSPQVMNLSRDARLLFIGLITQADDEGRGIADPRKLKAVIFGGDDDVTVTRVQELLGEIENQLLCITYDGNGHGRLYALPSWRSHQYVEKCKKSAYPPPKTEPFPTATPSGRGTGGEPAGNIPHGSDLKDRKDLKEGSIARARVREGARRAEPKNGANAPSTRDFAAEARKLAEAGSDAATIEKVLHQFGVTAEQVQAWLAA